MSLADIQERGGAGLLHNYYGNSIIKALSTIYPGKVGDILLKRRTKYQGKYWRERQVSFSPVFSLIFIPSFQISMSKLLVMTLRCPQKEFSRMFFAIYYDFSMSYLILFTLCCSLVIVSLKFLPFFAISSGFLLISIDKMWNELPQSYWNDVKNRKELLDRIGKRIGIRTFEDWYHVDPAEVIHR